MMAWARLKMVAGVFAAVIVVPAAGVLWVRGDDQSGPLPPAASATAPVAGVAALIERYGKASSANVNTITSGTTTYRSRGISPPGADNRHMELAVERAWDPNGRVDCRVTSWDLNDKGERIAKTGTQSRYMAVADMAFHIGSGIGVPPIQASIYRTAESARRRFGLIADRDSMGGFLDGRVPLYWLHVQSISDLLTRPGASVTANDEVLDGEPCTRLVVASKDYRGEVWIAPQKGYQCLRFSLEHGPMPGFDDGEGHPFKAYRRTLDRVRVERIDDKWIPVAGRLTTAALRYDGSSFTEEVSVTRDQVKVNPDFEALGTFELTGIPEGCRIRDEAAGGVEFEWRNGKIVPRVDERGTKR